MADEVLINVRTTGGDRAARELRRTGDAAMAMGRRVGSSSRGAATSTTLLDTSMRRLYRTGEITGKGLRNFNTGLISTGTATTALKRGVQGTTLALGYMGVRGVKAGLGFNAAFQDATTSFTTFLGTGERAQAFIEDLRSVSNTSPFRLTDFMAGSRQLLGFGMAAKKVTPLLGAVNAAVIANGGGTDMLNSVVMSLGQIKAKGRVQSEELMQLAEAGVPVNAILQKELGLSAAQVGNIGNENVSADKAIAAIQKGWMARYGKSADNASGNFSLQSSRIRKNIEQLERVATAPLFEKLNREVFPQAIGLTDRMTKLFGRNDLSLGDKLKLSAQDARRTFKPFTDEAHREIASMHLGDKLADGFEAAVPKLADAAGRASGKAVTAFVSGWWHAGAWGKLFTLGLLAKKLGVFGTLGGMAAKRFRDRFIAGAATSAAGSAAGSTAASVAGGAAAGAGAGSFWRKLGGTAGKVGGAALLFNPVTAATAAFALGSGAIGGPFGSEAGLTPDEERRRLARYRATGRAGLNEAEARRYRTTGRELHGRPIIVATEVKVAERVLATAVARAVADERARRKG